MFMKYFKTNANASAESYEITPEDFKKHTGERIPFKTKNDKSGFSYYAMCPSCANPIQLIGINKKIKYRPYGKHTGLSVAGFPEWNYIKYQFCPYAADGHYREPDPDERGIITEDTVILYDLLRSQFDRVAYIISKKTGCRFTSAFWRHALSSYCASEGYCYPWLTMANIPLVFLYIGVSHLNPYGQKFKISSPAYNALSRHKHIIFEDCREPHDKGYAILRSKGNDFLQLYIRVTEHRQHAKSGEELTETIFFCIDDEITRETIYQEKLCFEESYFRNLISKQENEDKRQQWLLDLATENLPPIFPG